MRFLALDGLRGFLAIIIVLFHLDYLHHFYLIPMVRNGWLFVDYFFVLSGFVMTLSYADRLHQKVSFREFMAKRFGRLWPLHIAVLAGFVLNECLKFPALGLIHSDCPAFGCSNSPSLLLANVFLLQAVDLFDHNGWNEPSWTISAEFYIYLLFGAALYCWRKGFDLLSAVFAVIGALWLHHAKPDNIGATFDYGLLRAMYGFFLGCLAFRLFVRTRPFWEKKAVWLFLLETAVFLAVYEYVSYHAAGQASFYAPLIFTLLVYFLAFEKGPFGWLLGSRVMQTLGHWSFSIYMVHKLVLYVMTEVLTELQRRYGIDYTLVSVGIPGVSEDHLHQLRGIWTSDALTLGYIAAVFGLAALTYRFVELPGQRYFNALILRHPRWFGRQPSDTSGGVTG